MNIDRRSFLALGAGATAGIALSPLPWKLMDDLSIWTQNWQWTPVPQNGEAVYKKTFCTLCPGGCALSIRKIGERVVKAEGEKDFFVNNSKICVLGLSAPQLLYSPSRIKTPLKRKGKRGDGWESISIEQAISEIAEKLQNIKKDEKADTVACISGRNNGTLYSLFKRFFKIYGSPNFITESSMYDTYEYVFELMHGEKAEPGFDIKNADFVLSFGSGLLDGWGSPVNVFQANSALKDKGAKVVQIEPRLSNTSAKADKWLPINPGTEGILALGIANVLIAQNLYNKDFVKKQSEGFERFEKNILNNYKPDFVSTRTGINENDIIEIAKAFGNASKPIALCGRGSGDTPGSVDEFMAIHTLNALCDRINKEGGVFAIPKQDYIKWEEPNLDNSIAFNRLLNSVISSNEPVLNALFVIESNPYYTMPDTNFVKEAFNKIPFIVSFSPYMDETSEMADIILPNHAFMERYEDRYVTSGLTKHFIGLAKPVVNPMFNTINTGDAIIKIAKKMGGSIADAFSWSDYEDCLKKTFGEKWNNIDKKGILPIENAVNSRKFKFSDFSSYREVAAEGAKEEYPLTFIGYDTMRISAGSKANSPFMTKIVDDTVIKDKDVFIEINSETAKSYGLSDNKYAYIKTPKGKAKVKINISEGIAPNVIAMPKGLGHTAYDKYIADKGVNINELIGYSFDPVSGLNAAWGIRARLERA